jgi:hypothetical protein
MQVACKELGPHGRGGLVLGIDIQEVRVSPPCVCWVCALIEQMAREPAALCKVSQQFFAAVETLL